MFEFLKNEIEKDGVKICVGDVWETSDNHLVKVIAIDKEYTHYIFERGGKVEVRKFPNSSFVRRGDTLFERDGRKWPHEEALTMSQIGLSRKEFTAENDPDFMREVERDYVDSQKVGNVRYKDVTNSKKN